MKNQNLTKNQQEFLDQLADSFAKLNDEPTKSLGLIDVQNIKSDALKELNWQQEIKNKSDAYKELKKAQVDNDIKKLNVDLSALNMVAENYIGYLRILPTNSNSVNIEHHNTIRLEYYDYEYREYKYGKLTERVYLKWKVVQYSSTFGYNSIDSADTIEEFVKLPKFKDDISRLYKRFNS